MPQGFPLQPFISVTLYHKLSWWCDWALDL